MPILINYKNLHLKKVLERILMNTNRPFDANRITESIKQKLLQPLPQNSVNTLMIEQTYRNILNPPYIFTPPIAQMITTIPRIDRIASRTRSPSKRRTTATTSTTATTATTATKIIYKSVPFIDLVLKIQSFITH